MDQQEIKEEVLRLLGELEDCSFYKKTNEAKGLLMEIDEFGMELSFDAEKLLDSIREYVFECDGVDEESGLLETIKALKEII